MTDIENGSAATARFLWTPEMDSAIKAGYEAGKSARIIAEQLGTTRNSVLGRTFRLGLCKSISEPREPSVKASKPDRASLVQTANKLKVIPSEVIERLKDLHELGASWGAIATELEVSIPTARSWGLKSGVFVPKKYRKFTEEEIADIREGWNRSEPIEDIAARWNRSFGVIRQQIHKMQNLGTLGTRDPAKTMLLKRYGEAALAAGETPAEALRKMGEAKQAAFAAAINASRSAKQKFKDMALSAMREAISSGSERNAAIFAARAEGVTLEEIANEFGITRERIRQICSAHAQVLALRSITT